MSRTLIIVAGIACVVVIGMGVWDYLAFIVEAMKRVLGQ